MKAATDEEFRIVDNAGADLILVLPDPR